MTHRSLSWLDIVRLGLVQSAIGSIVVLTTSTLNRVMVVELALPAMLPAGLVAWHYAVQLSRPRWGYNADMGRRRTPWIIGGMGALALGALAAANATAVMASAPLLGAVIAVIAFSLIGAGVGAAGTSLLALLASRTAPTRRPAAAAITWIMMIVGIILTAGIGGAFLDPFSFPRLATVAGVITLAAFAVTLLAVAGVEGAPERAVGPPPAAKPPFGEVLRETLADPQARRFGIFVFVSMLAYSAQDLILEPFAGLLFGLTPGQSTQLSGVQHMGVLLGMILVGAAGGAFARGRSGWMRGWTVAGCLGSAAALAGLGLAARAGPAWPLEPTVFVLGFANGVFAVAAIGSMMGLAGEGQPEREGVRMGVWGAAQAIAFALGGFLGAVGVDVGRSVFGADAPAFILVFSLEAALFVAAAGMALRAAEPRAARPTLHGGAHVPA